MRRTPAALATLPAMLAALALLRCGSDLHGEGPETTDAGADPDVVDPRCELAPMLLTTHPHAAATRQDLLDARGFHGRVYFGYGDIDGANGPVVMSSWEPASGTWRDHLTLDARRVERLRVIGDELWALAEGPQSDAGAAYAFGTANHVWTSVDVAQSIALVDVAERGRGDVFLVGAARDERGGPTFGAVWRSQNGAALQRVFPTNADAGPGADAGANEPIFANAGALNGALYAGSDAPPWTFDGNEWARAEQLGGFLHPIAYADTLVFSALGELWSFDGTRRTNLGVTLVDTAVPYAFVKDSLAVTSASEGRFLAVNAKLDTLVTTDLIHWSCVGRAPSDVRSIGALDGTVYFGGAAGRVYALSAPSW